MNYTIGKAAKLVDLSTKTLRYYDQIGLVCPSIRDNESGYRYYSQSQINTLSAIKYLHMECNLSLADIGALIPAIPSGNSTFLDCLEFADKALERQIEDLVQRRLLLHEKISHLKQNSAFPLLTALVQHLPKRTYYLKTISPTTSHEEIQNAMFCFRRESILGDPFHMGLCGRFDIESEQLTWLSNGVCVYTEEKLPSLRMTLIEGDYLTIYFNDPFHDMEAALENAKNYANEQQLQLDDTFFIVIDTFDGAMSLNIADHLCSLQIRLI